MTTATSTLITAIKNKLAASSRTVYWLAKTSGISQGHMTNLMNGKRTFSDDVLDAISAALELDPDYLRAIKDAESIDMTALERIRKYVPQAKELQSLLVSRVQFSYAGKVGCGARLELQAGDMIEITEQATRHGDFAVTACGDSMTRVPIFEGDVLVVKAQNFAQDGDIVIAHLAWDGATCKRYKVIGGQAYLVPESFSDAHETIKADEQVTILGVVTYVERPGIQLRH